MKKFIRLINSYVAGAILAIVYLLGVSAAHVLMRLTKRHKKQGWQGSPSLHTDSLQWDSPY